MDKEEHIASWKDLDKDILLRISGFIPDTLLPAVGYSCKRWYSILTPKIWRNIYKNFGNKRNKLDILKKYGKYVEYVEQDTMELPEVGMESWLDYCKIWYYYLPLYNSDVSYSYELLSFKALPKKLKPIPLFYLCYGEDWMNLVLLTRMLDTQLVIEGFYLNCLEEPAIRLQSLPTELKSNVKTLKIDIGEYFSLQYLIELTLDLPVLNYLELSFDEESTVEEWTELEKFLKNSRNITYFKLNLDIQKCKQLYNRGVPFKESVNYKTNIKTLEIDLPHRRPNRIGLLSVYKNIEFNFFHLLLISSPNLTEVSLAATDYNILCLLAKNCPNLKKLCTQTPIQNFFDHTPSFKKLKQLSTSSLHEIHYHMIYGFETIFPAVTELYIDHYFSHTAEFCSSHNIYLLPKLFPKLVTLKLSHDIDDTTLERFLERTEPLYLTHLYLHGSKGNWENLTQIIKEKCPNLHTITYEWCSHWERFENIPLHQLVTELPAVKFFVARFKKPFEYDNVSKFNYI
jgi:hypothetical protein